MVAMINSVGQAIPAGPEIPEREFSMRIAEPVSTLVSAPAELATMTSRVDPEGARRMMEMLVNLYADRRLAVVREYVSNAVDASRAAGNGDPVSVSTPTLLEPNLVVADRGTGMSLSEVESTFLAFAASSKRESNDLIGGLGVGAKSAWALAESFLVDTVKDGRRTAVRAASNLEHQVLVAGAPSDLPNGTTIIVPVEVAGCAEVWQRVVREVASAHDEGAVLVDGQPVDSIGGGPGWIGPVACRRVDRPDRSTVVVRSGGTLFSSVPEITSRVLEKTGLTACVIELPIGSFDHTPSRESVIATDRTRAAVDAALGEFTTAFASFAQRLADLAATDAGSAAKVRAETLGTAGSGRMLPIPFRFGFPAECQEWVMAARSGRNRWERTGNARDSTFEAVGAGTELGATLVISDVPAGRAIARFAKFLADEHPKVRRVVAIPAGQSTVTLSVFRYGGEMTAQSWEISASDAGVHYTFERLRAVLAAGRTQRRSARGYECVVVGVHGAHATMATLSAVEVGARGLPVVYIEGERPVGAVVGGPASVTVYLGRRKCGPLLAEVPQAVSREVWAEQQFSAVAAEWSHTEALGAVYAVGWADRSAFEIVAAALATRSAGDSREELLEQVAQVAEAAGQTTEAQIATVRSWNDSASARKLRAEVMTLHSRLMRAYPLLRYTGYWGNEKSHGHYADYVAHTPAASESEAA